LASSIEINRNEESPSAHCTTLSVERTAFSVLQCFVFIWCRI